MCVCSIICDQCISLRRKTDLKVALKTYSIKITQIDASHSRSIYIQFNKCFSLLHLSIELEIPVDNYSSALSKLLILMCFNIDRQIRKEKKIIFVMNSLLE